MLRTTRTCARGSMFPAKTCRGFSPEMSRAVAMPLGSSLSKRDRAAKGGGPVQAQRGCPVQPEALGTTGCSERWILSGGFRGRASGLRMHRSSCELFTSRRARTLIAALGMNLQFLIKQVGDSGSDRAQRQSTELPTVSPSVVPPIIPLSGSIVRPARVAVGRKRTFALRSGHSTQTGKADHRLTTETLRINSDKGGRTQPNITVFIDLFDRYLRSGRRGRRFESCHSDQAFKYL
jgi:hypothetical protein